MTSKQIDALSQYADAVDAFIHAFAQDYPTQAAAVETHGMMVKMWADTNPAPE